MFYVSRQSSHFICLREMQFSYEVMDLELNPGNYCNAISPNKQDIFICLYLIFYITLSTKNVPHWSEFMWRPTILHRTKTHKMFGLYLGNVTYLINWMMSDGGSKWFCYLPNSAHHLVASQNVPKRKDQPV